jgi:hypothetical protein
VEKLEIAGPHLTKREVGKQAAESQESQLR